MASDAADEEVCAANGQVSQEQFLATKMTEHHMIPNGRDTTLSSLMRAG